MNLFIEKKIFTFLMLFSAAASLFAIGKDRNKKLTTKTGYTVALAEKDPDDKFFEADSDDTFFMGDDDALFGGDDDAFFSDDDMFSGEDDMFSDSMIDEGNAIESETPLDFDISNIYAEKVFRFGCSLESTIDGMFLWYDPYKDGNRNPEFVKQGFKDFTFTPKLLSDFYFDVRPKDNLRFYAKAKFQVPQPTLYPFNSDKDNIYPAWKHTIKWFEYFMDYSLKDRVFFRLGKHTVTWGVGYFFSPADVINLSAVDPENPTEQREGAISLRTQVVFPGTQNCLWFYVLPDIKTNKDDEDSTAVNAFSAGKSKNKNEDAFDIKNDLKYTAFAAKYEFLIKNFEVGLGAWFKYGRTPRAVATLTGGIGKVATFSELVFGYGTEEQWQPLSKNGKGSPKYSDMKPVVQATTGFSYTWKEPKVTLMGQYFFNGFGEKKPRSLSEIDFMKLKNAYTYAGRHFAAISLSKEDLFVRDCSGSIYSLVSISDWSGMVQGTVSYAFKKDFKVSTGPVLTFGMKGSEFTRTNGFIGSPAFAWKLSLTYGIINF